MKLIEYNAKLLVTWRVNCTCGMQAFTQERIDLAAFYELLQDHSWQFIGRQAKCPRCMEVLTKAGKAGKNA